MNLNFRKIARIVMLLTCLGLVLVLSSSGISRAEQSQGPLPAKSAQSGAGITSFQSSFQQTDPPGADPELMRSLRASARGAPVIHARKSTGFANFVRVGQGGDLLPASQGRAPEEKAAAFLAQYGGLFGVRDASRELAQVSTALDRYGATHLTYQQVYNNVPVFAGTLRVHLDAAGRLTAANGAFVPDLNVDTTPALSAEEAATRAIADVQAKPPSDNERTGASASISADGLKAESSTLFVYRDGLIQDVPGSSLLVYQVVVSDGASLREVVFVDAHTGKVANRYSAIPDALFRRLFEMNTSNQVWQEGDPFPGALNQDQQNIVNFSGQAYYLFFNTFARDSYNGAGAEMQSVNNDPTIACPNANWNGATTNYCNGVTSDDVVAHEWGHAYTEYTSNLIYQWQPGALNESYSDIWGETVDMLNLMGTDAPAPVRSPEVCSIYTTPVPRLTINSPASIAGDYLAGAASFGPPLTAAGITGDVVLADDGAGVPSDACTALVNNLSGKIGLVDRGACAFTIKVKNAQNAGAIGVIVADNVAGPVAGMSGSDPTIVISSLRVTLATGNIIKAELANTVNATLTIVGGAAPEDSYRWLLAEDSTAFGSAIRDMWAPTCKADPSKVTDAEYHCFTSDGGGVHTNSGVPNHGYALLVDGGSYNGQTISAIGLVKAAHIYWRAQAVYQTETSNFNDHADALEAACSDLIGVPLEGLSVTSTPAGPSGEAITAADCTQVTNMIAAVELRTDPSVQCNFQPALQPNPPALCSSGNPRPVFREDFEKGLERWTLSNQGVYEGWPGLDWVKNKSLPGGRKGPAAYAADPNAGNCDEGVGDISGRMSMESPAIRIPSGSSSVARMSFDHYFATESGYDGGNLKISINGGAYTLVPASAYTFNPYNLTLVAAPPAGNNTNPLAGQPAFSGTDGGQLTGSWGQSQIDLAALGVHPGDTIRLRYDFGMDGCAGIDGWYVDNVNVVTCRP